MNPAVVIDADVVVLLDKLVLVSVALRTRGMLLVLLYVLTLVVKPCVAL